MAKELTTTVRLMGVLDPSLQRTFNTVKKELKGLQQSKDIQNFSDRWQAMGKHVSKIGTQITNVGTNMTKKLTVPIVAGMTVATKAAGDFQYRFAKVASIVVANGDKSAGSLANLQKSIKNAATETGIAADKYSELVYQAISANVSAKNSIKAVSDAHKLAVAGFTSDSAALDILTTVTNAYGKSAGSMSHISDVLIQTQNRGKVTVDQLASSMGKVIPTAKSMNVSFEDLGAQYALLTQRGIKSRQATTYINSMINELGKGGSKVSKILKDETGKSFSELTKSGKSVGDVLQIIKNHCDKTGQSFHDLWGNVNSSKAAESLADGAQAYNKYLGEMRNGSGTTQKAFDSIADTFPKKLAKLKGSLKNALIGLGDIGIETIGPLLKPITTVIQKVTVAINNMSPGMKKFIGHCLLAVAALGPMMVIIGKLTTGVGKFMNVIGMLSGALGALPAAGIGVSKFAGIFTGLGTSLLGVGKYALIAVAAIAAVALAVKGIKKWSDHNKKKKAAGSSVQKKYDDLQQAKASYSKNKSADNKAALQQAQKSYDNAQKAYMQKYKKPFKVDMKVEAKDKTKKKDLGKETVKSAKANLKEVKKQYKKAEKAAKNHAKDMGEYAKEMAREDGASKKEQKKAYQDAYNEAIKTNKKLNKAKKNLSEASEGVKSAKSKQSKVKQTASNQKEKAKTARKNAQINVVKTRAQNIGSNMAAGWQNLKGAGQNVGNSLVAGFQSARARVSGINQQIRSNVSSSWANMKASVSAHASGLAQAAQGKWAALKANTAASFSNIRTSMSTKMASAKQAVGNHLAAIRAAFSNRLSGAASAVRGAMSNVKRAFQNALNGIKNWVRNKLAEIRNLFAHPIQATVNVVQNMFGGGKGGKGGGKKAKGHAKGGFTNGIAIAGEDPHYPVEAVISFNPAYRKKNIEYWERAGRMLGVYQNSADAQSYLNAVSNIPSYKPSTGDADTNLDLTATPAQQYSEQVSAAAQTYAAYNEPNRLGDYDYDDFSRLGMYSSVVSNTQEMYDSMSGSSPNALGDYETDDFSKLGTERPTYSASIGRSLFNGNINFPLADTVGYQQESTQTQRVDVGGITIAPTINVPKGTADITAERIVDLLRGYGPEFTDMVVEKIQERMNGRYVTA